jgi:hypothetical protein
MRNSVPRRANPPNASEMAANAGTTAAANCSPSAVSLSPRPDYLSIAPMPRRYDSSFLILTVASWINTL